MQATDNGTAHNTENEVTVEREVEKSLDWKKPGRNTVLMTQVVFAGQLAWITCRANVKADKVTGKGGIQYKQKEVWMNKTDGIVPMLAKHEAFAGAPLPTDEPTAIINHVNSLLKKSKHLYTQGMEQAEPAEAGTDGTKDESALTDLDKAIIEVAELQASAKELTEANASGKKAAQAVGGAAGAFMQGEAVKKKYGSMSADELKSARTSGSRKERETINIDDDDDLGQGKARKVDLPKQLTVQEYCEFTGANEEAILKGARVKGFRLIDPDEPKEAGLEHPFREPYLLKTSNSNTFSPSGVSTFRSGLLEKLAARNQSKDNKEKNRHDEAVEDRKLKKRKLKLEEMKLKFQIAQMQGAAAPSWDVQSDDSD